MVSINQAEKNGMWKGDDPIHKSSLHEWVRNHMKQPELCEFCNITKSLDLANITGIYNREFKNWKYLCRRCHMLSDGRLEKFLEYAHNYDLRFKTGSDQ